MILVYVGRLEKIKGVYDFVNQFKGYLKKGSCFHLLVVGEGKEKNKLIKLKEHKALDNLTLIPWQSRIEVFKILRKADLFIHPNKYSEGTPNSLIEAQGVGLPIAAFDIEGVRDIVKDGINGVLEPSKSMKSFCDNIILLNKGFIYKKVFNRKHSLGFGFIGSAWLKFYCKILNGVRK